MIRNSILPIFLFAITLFCGSGSPNAAKFYSVFTDTQRGYSFTHPLDWKAHLYRSGIVVSEVNHPNGSAGVQFRIANLNTSIDQFSEAYARKSALDMKGRINSATMITVNGIQCLEIEMETGNGSKKYYLYQLVYFFENLKKVIIIQSGCRAEDYHLISSTLHFIAKSLKINQSDKL